MHTILCSTGTCIGRPNGRNYHLLGDLAPQLHCDGLEFMMYDSWYDQTEALGDFLLSLNLPIPVMHCEKRLGEQISLGQAEALDLFTRNCALAQRLGAGKLVLHLWDGLTSDRYFERNLAAYSQLKSIARSHGLDLLVENVVCNTEDPMLHWLQLRDADPDVHFVFDTKMAAFHGQLELIYSPEYAWLWQEGHICHLHMNDYAGGLRDWAHLRTLPIGSGQIDWEHFFRFLRQIGYTGSMTVESTAFNTAGCVDLEMLNRQFHLLQQIFD